MIITTGCKHTLTLPASLAACAEACGLGLLTPSQAIPEMAATCSKCTFASQKLTTTSTSGVTFNVIPALDVVDVEATSTDAEVTPSSVEATPGGFVPVPSNLPVEPIVRAGEAGSQDTPPSVDLFAARTAEVKALLEEVTDTDDASPSTPPPPFEEVLAAGCDWWKPGGSLMGWSKLKDAKICLRLFYYKHVLGLERKTNEQLFSETPDPKRISARDLGVLVHACIENFYRHGDVARILEPIEAIKGAYPQLALEARRLCNFYLDRFNAIEVKEWDVRCVERESRYYFPARKVGAKRRRCCITSRLDGCYRKMKPGEGRLPPGERAVDGLRIHELKTVQYIGHRIRGFYMKAQLLQQLLTFNSGYLVSKKGEVLTKSLNELVGETWDVTVTHLGKAMKQDPNKDIERTTFSVPKERVERYAASMGDWYYEEVLDRLFSPHNESPSTWPMDWLCEDIHWCPTLDQRILTADLRWVQAGSLKIGDELLGFDEMPTLRSPQNIQNHRRYRYATVVHNTPTKRHVFRLLLEDGTSVRASIEHPWLVATKRALNQSWMTTEEIVNRVGSQRETYMLRLFHPWETDESYLGGWLSGVFDGEGSLSIRDCRGELHDRRDRMLLAVAQKPGTVLTALETTLRAFGFAWSDAVNARQVHQLQIRGGWRESARLLGQIRPLRLLEKFLLRLRDGYFQKEVSTVYKAAPPRVVDVIDEGKQWCAGIESTTKTYVCEGFGAHNTGYTCPFIPLCEADEADADLLFAQHSKLNPEDLELPKKLAKPDKAKAAVADTK